MTIEAITTATQLILPMAQASATLAGDSDPVTPWDRWSRFLETGGQFVLAFGSAILVAAMTRRTRGAQESAIVLQSSSPR